MKNTTKVKLSIARTSKANDKPESKFYYQLGNGEVIGNKGNEVITLFTVPGVSVSGGLIQVEKDKELPAHFQPRMEVYAEWFDSENKAHSKLIGSAFAVNGKKGMYSISFADGVAYSGKMIIVNPKPKSN